MCIKRHIVSENGAIVPIQRRRELSPIKGAHNESPEVGSRANNAVNAVRTAERIKVPVFSTISIAVKANHSGFRLVESSDELMKRKCLCINRSTVNIMPKQTLNVLIINHSSHDRHLLKYARVGYTIPLFGEGGSRTWQTGDRGDEAVEQDFDEIKFVSGKLDPSGLCPIFCAVNMITFEGEESIRITLIRPHLTLRHLHLQYQVIARRSRILSSRN